VQPQLPAPKIETLSNKELTLSISSYDATLTTATLEKYPEVNEEGSKPLSLNLANLLKITTPEQKDPRIFTVKEKQDRSITLETEPMTGLRLERTFKLDETGYHLAVTDRWVNTTATPIAFPKSTLSAGTLAGASVDLAIGAYDPSEEEVVLRAAQGMGCGCSCSETIDSVPANPQSWLALSNRYFLALLAPKEPKKLSFNLARPQNDKADAKISGDFAFDELALAPNATVEQTHHLYIGPKIYDNLTALSESFPVAIDAEDMMDFGMFAWFAKLLLKGMNFFYSIIPNYGVAIILLTIIVRLIFWPLTRKSTLAMRKMTEVQPLIKEVQEKFKGNPQKIQQETFMIYRKYQVNPLASCFPMLIQIPIFIAFFAMLRSVAELRFEGFLWISDLSQPENLFAGTLPIAINILPILTSVTMAIQTHLSPSSGDPAQKKMMTWMMPIMMLFFFYNMSSALCLYWTVSQLLSIAQMLWMRRTTPATTKA
jgi:YidC/Oxa1 family membrane protein insertase